MAEYNIAQAKARLSELVNKAVAGDDVIIARDHQPLVRLVPVDDPSKPLKPGSARGQIWIANDFDAPLDDLNEYQ